MSSLHKFGTHQVIILYDLTRFFPMSFQENTLDALENLRSVADTTTKKRLPSHIEG